ncbi:MAG: HAD family hydrolase [Parachlamydiaceae bacterium]|nr:HAD family hydrolase [Parachlamydiaceae bacterium]
MIDRTRNFSTVAAFDFDGTLTQKDTLLPFIHFCKGSLHTGLYLAEVLPYVAGFALGIKTRQQVKESLLTNAFGGEPYAKILEQGNEFAKHQIHSRLTPKALAKLYWHQQEGHRCVLISANLNVFLLPWAKKMGFDDLLCSQLDVDKAGRVTGKLLGHNCWGNEKVVRLKQLLGPKEKYTLYAYGDSRGDRELLEFADYPFYHRFE